MMQLSVAGMTCQHCVAAVTRAVQALPAVEQVAVDLDRGVVTIAGRPDPALVRAAIAEEGYEVVSLAA